MPFAPIQKLVFNQSYEGVWRIAQFSLSSDRNGNPMARLELADAFDRLPAVFFSINENNLSQKELFIPSGFAKVAFRYEEDARYGPQAKVISMQGVTLSEAGDLTQLIPALPDRRENLNALYQCGRLIQSSGLRSLVLYVLERYQSVLIDLPAAKSMHHDVLGGWVFHTLRMARLGYSLCRVYPEVNQDLLISGILLHDLGKLQEFSRDPTGMVIDYSVSGVLLSHLVIGLLMLEEILKEMKAKNLPVPSENERLALFHMIESHHGKPEYGSPITPRFREAMILHFLDQIDAKIWMFDQVQGNLDPGKLSEKTVFCLDGRVWRPE